MQMLDADWEYYWAHRYVRLLVTVKVPANGYSTFVIHEKTPDNVTENTYYAKYFEQQHLPFKDFVGFIKIIIGYIKGSLKIYFY